MTALSTVALLVALPGGRDTTTAQPRLATELRSLMQPRLWVAYATTALTVAAQFAIFSYLGALLEDVTGLSAGLVPPVLGLYGVGAFIGLTIGGRVADRAPFTLLLVGMAAFIVSATALAVAPLTSGLVINTGLGLAGTAWIGAAFGVAHMGSVLLDRHLTRRHEAGSKAPATAPSLSA